MQKTYFCNVHRENDKVTKWIRENWTPAVIGWEDYEYAMVLARFINWPDTLGKFRPSGSPLYDLRPESINRVMGQEQLYGKVWGNAYVVTTHGIPMDKIDYLTDRILPAAYKLLGAGRWRTLYQGTQRTLAQHHGVLMQLEGLGSFMAAQVIADLKNTVGHPLQDAPDWWTWSAPGPGSMRGLNWFFGKRIPPSQYTAAMDEVAYYIKDKIDDMPAISMQDLQNCLCEYDKYMRVKTNTGRLKRGYNGT